MKLAVTAAMDMLCQEGALDGPEIDAGPAERTRRGDTARPLAGTVPPRTAAPHAAETSRQTALDRWRGLAGR